MGLGNGENNTYLGIIDGKITLKCKEGDQGAVKRINKDGQVVWEQKFGYVEGVLKSIGIQVGSYNNAEIKNWVFTIDDNGKRYILQVGYDSRYATSLLFALCNPACDFDKPIKISPWLKIQGDKKKMSCFLSQDGDNIDWFFTKDDPRGMPEWTVKKVKGKDVWDNYDAMQFLEQFIKDNVIPQLNGNSGSTSFPMGNPVDINSAPEADDLPF